MPEYPEFDGSNVIVTGASAGLGRAVALGFGEAGAHVINADIRTEPKRSDQEIPTHERIEDETAGSAEFVETDVSDLDDLEDLFAVSADHGGVDVLVNNAGIQVGNPKIPFQEVTEDLLKSHFEVNVYGLFFASQLAANQMIEHDTDGAIVNFASINSFYSLDKQSYYDPTKGAVKMITKDTALELADDGIRVNAVAPGPMETEIIEGWSEVAEEEMAAGIFHKKPPIERPGYPEDVIDPVMFLSSNEAASYITGEIVMVEGGWTIY